MYMMIGLIGFVALYCGVFFPFAYFRHDDWLILGNAVLKLPQDWTRLWKATLFYGDVEVIWFFRPFFKGLTYVFSQLFHLHYYPWILTIFVIFMVAVWAAAQSIAMVKDSSFRAKIFVIAFLGSLYLHFGSLVWMGEGMMNIPQMALLAVSTLLFVRSTLSENRLWGLGGALVCYILALGFKEAAVVHPGWLFVMLVSEKKWAPYPWQQKLKWLAPYAVLTLCYLVYRFSLPVSPSSYLTYFAWPSVLKLLTLFTGPICFLFALAFLCFRSRWRLSHLTSSILYFGFFALTVLPYVGNGFFSPGWLVIPGFYGCWIFALVVPLPEIASRPIRLRYFSGILTSVSLCVVFFQLSQLGWWQWGEGGKALKQYVETAKPQSGVVSHWTFFDCQNPDYPKMGMARVVAFEAGMDFLWRMHHASRASFQIESCGRIASFFTKGEGKRFFWFQFPKLVELVPLEGLTPNQKTALVQ